MEQQLGVKKLHLDLRETVRAQSEGVSDLSSLVKNSKLSKLTGGLYWAVGPGIKVSRAR